jgi:hypothetical protein
MENIYQSDTTPIKPKSTLFKVAAKIFVGLVVGVLPFAGFYLGTKTQNQKPTTAVIEKPCAKPVENKTPNKKITVTLPSDPNLSIKENPVDLSGNRLSLEIVDNTIEGVSFAWAEIDVLVTPSGGENLKSFVSNSDDSYIKGLFRPTVVNYNPLKTTLITKWATDVYSYTKEDSLGGYKKTLYIFKHDQDFVLVQTYINNSTYLDQYNAILNPILDSLSFQK